MVLLFDKVNLAILIVILIIITPIIMLSVSVQIKDKKPKLAKVLAIIGGICLLIGFGSCGLLLVMSVKNS